MLNDIFGNSEHKRIPKLITDTLYEKVIMFLLIGSISLIFFNTLHIPTLVIMITILFYALCLKFIIIILIYTVYGFPESHKIWCMIVSIFVLYNSPTLEMFLIMLVSIFLTTLFDHLFWKLFKMNAMFEQVSNDEQVFNHYNNMSKILFSAGSILIYILVGAIALITHLDTLFLRIIFVI